MVKNSLRVCLENETKTFYPGQIINGFIEIKIENPIKKTVKGLTLLIEGKCVTEWMDSSEQSSSSSNNNNHSHTYRGEEIFINYTKHMFGNKIEDQPTFSAPCEYKFPFTYQLPLNLPYSIEADLAHIRFSIKAKLEIAWGFDMGHEIQFQVIRYDDLNYYPELKEAIEIDKVRKVFLSCISDRSKRLIFTVILEKSGFALGEIARIRIEYQNKSNIKVKKTLIQLIKIEKFNSQGTAYATGYARHVPIGKGYSRKYSHSVGAQTSGNSLVKKTKVTTETAEGVSKNVDASVEHFLKIPQDLQTSNEKFSRIYQIFYKLKITAIANSFFSSQLVIKVPIIIGNVAIINP